MKKFTTQELVVLAVSTAVIVAISRVILIPVPTTNGLVTICDAGIYIMAMLFGPLGGLIVGALSGFLIDLTAGYMVWMIPSAIIHGLQGYIFGKFYMQGRKMMGYVVSGIFMIVCYAIATGLIYDLAAGLYSFPSNSMQIIFSVIIAELLGERLIKALKR